MDYIINGQRPLSGELSVYGAKNCALALLGATVLTDEEITLLNCPKIDDVENMLLLLKSLGKTVSRTGTAVSVKGHILTTRIPKEQAKLLRGSGLVLGSLLAKYNHAFLPETGGCAIGKRPIDIHLDGLKAMGIVVKEEGGVECEGRPRGCDFRLRFASVGATENLLCAATLAHGTVTLNNCALEPEVVALELLLQSMGADLQGVGTGCIEIAGVNRLHGAVFEIIPDRIVTATYLACCAASGGKLTVTDCNPLHIASFLKKLSDFKLKVYSNAVTITANTVPYCYGKTVTAPYPAFPTDLQQVLLSLCALSAGGTSFVTEKMFENRLQHNAEELNKMGARVTVVGDTAVIEGTKLHGAKVAARDLRGGAGLVVAALGANGQTEICGVQHVLRGYDHLAECLCKVGADVTVIN